MTVGRTHAFTLDEAVLLDGAQVAAAGSGLPRRLTYTTRGLFRFDGYSLADWYGGANLGVGSTGQTGYSVFAAGRWGHALYFSNGWAQVPWPSVPQSNTAFGVAAWMRLGSNNTNAVVYSTRFQGAGAGTQITVTTPNVLRVVIAGAAGSIDLTYAMPFANWNSSTFHHWALSYTGSGLASGVTLHIDGSVVTPTISADNITVHGGYNVADLGCNPSGGGGLLVAGYVDEFFFRTGALTVDDLTALLAGGTPAAHVRYSIPVAGITPSALMAPGGVRTKAALGVTRETRAYASLDGGVTPIEFEIDRVYPDGLPAGGVGSTVTFDLYSAGWIADALGGGPTALYDEADPPPVVVQVPGGDVSMTVDDDGYSMTVEDTGCTITLE